MVTRGFLAGRGRDRLSGDDRLALDQAVVDIKQLPARRTLVRAGDVVEQSTMLLEGFMCRYMDDRDGFRQLVAVHVPGDFVDLHAFPMRRLDHDVATLSACTVAVVPHEALSDITNERPALTRALWFSTLLDAAMHREWIFRLGRLGAEGRLAHFFMETATRMRMVGLVENDRFHLPLTQADIAEACGLTGVHVNRTLRSLREQELMTFSHGEVKILDPKRMTAIGEFEPAYLYGDPR
ncbi:Crp/Fnr family transcriptional regulator [Sphingomonas jinjuensis]|uniref:Crp/Fnr family transcriptional regulator n=1 Tax=Sphingomonas jinjuensis TaxID=535907 RepID=UPI0016153897|nr:Crp/Fnr family transcriptional regulator [Sphingomonas jinjuensis]